MLKRRKRRAPTHALHALLAVLWSGVAAFAAETNAPAASQDYDAYKLILERNIFNQNRTRDNMPSAAGPVSRTPRVENFALVGTIVGGEKGSSAFFEGSSDAFKKRVRESETIANYNLTEILPNSVKLMADDKTVELIVGMQMQRRDEGEWVQAEYTPVTSDIPVREQLLTRNLNVGRRGGRGGQGGGGFGGGAAGIANVLQQALGGGAGFGGFNGNTFDDGTGGGGRGRTRGGDQTGGGGRGGRNRTGETGTGEATATRTPTTTLTTTPSTGESEADIIARLQRAREQAQ